jgi:general nucleoside transport system permease protein
MTELGPPSVAARLAFYERAGGIVTPLLTTLFALGIGGLVVVFTGGNPLSVYEAIFRGSGLDWPFLLLTGQDTSGAAFNLQQTLLLTTPLILTGLAVAFAFRCGLFNIGGQGQYTLGLIVAVWVGSSLAGLPGPVHVLLGVALASLAGAAYAGIAGLLRATVGAHEVITTIMLNWIAYWAGTNLFGQGGALQNDANPSIPVSNDVVESARLKVIWGSLQGLHVGVFVALAAVVAFWVVLNRTTLGYEIRAVGYNPEAARYGGIGVGRSYVVAMAIAGVFAGLAGALDVFGWQYRVDISDVQSSQIGFLGIAVALLGRNTAIGVLASALLFGALATGTSSRALQLTLGSGDFRPELGGDLALIIQGLVVLFVGADVLVIYLWRSRRRLKAWAHQMPRLN